MEGVAEEVSVDDAEDIPSDFFDDFNKAEFMEGLSVIDECWEDGSVAIPQKRDSRTRIVKDALDSVKDLRELIGDNCDDDTSKREKRFNVTADTNNERESQRHGTPHDSGMDSYCKPGSRRDPNKTNEAIKRDKEMKVQQFLAKSLEAPTNDLRPPGTELDDYYENSKKKEKKEQLQLQESRKSPRPHHSSRQHYSPRARRSPYQHNSPYMKHSPLPFRERNQVIRRSPYRSTRRNYSPQRRSPLKRSPRRRSPIRHSPLRRTPLRRSPVRRSPLRHSPCRQQRSRSPRRRISPRRLHSPSRSPFRDNFLYPNNNSSNNPSIISNFQGNPPYSLEYGQQYAPPLQPEFPGAAPGYHYPQIPAYGVPYTDTYDYGVPQAPVVNMPVPAIMPNMPAAPSDIVSPVQSAMIPAPVGSITEKASPYDALAQLVAEGKISKEDYLKLTPNKGVVSPMDTNTRVMVLTRCQEAIIKLDKLLVPNRLTLNNQIIGEDKYLAPKFCSPLKKQVITEFSFTKGLVPPEQQNKQLLESILSTLGLDKVVTKYKKKLPKNMKDGVVQTTKPQCDVCAIRDSTKYHDAATSTEPEYFTSTVHTQVVEQDLISSKAIFNPSGSVGEGAAISIAHMTPAQLVSQLAARAKTLKQPQDPPSHFPRRPNYEYDSRGGQQYHSYSNYRY